MGNLVSVLRRRSFRLAATFCEDWRSCGSCFVWSPLGPLALSWPREFSVRRARLPELVAHWKRRIANSRHRWIPKTTLRFPDPSTLLLPNTVGNIKIGNLFFSEASSALDRRQALTTFFKNLFGDTPNKPSEPLPDWIYRRWPLEALESIPVLSVAIMRAAANKLGVGKSCHDDCVLSEFVKALDDNALEVLVALFKVKLLNPEGAEKRVAVS